ncbi:Fatty-acid amide hydrolase 2, partial [Eufriesea mexicana]
ESDKCQRILEMSTKTLKNFLKCLFIQLHIIFDYLIDFIFGLYYNHKKQKVPPIKNNLLLMSASELAEKIRTKQISSLEVVTAFIERAKEVNGIINAVVEDRYSEALEEAKEVDKLLQTLQYSDSLKEKPLLGVPFTTKESNEAKDMLHTMGLTSRRSYRSKEDATAIGAVKNAGAILIAKTNIPELNLWTESRNNIYGQTCNPYDTTRNVGGSSGGEGAITAACGSAFSIGSDIGGSTRMPAFFNGVFGFKPTGGLTPLKGIGLRQQVYYIDSMAEVGPICRKAEDLGPLLKIVIGKNISLFDKEVDIKRLNIFYQESSGDIRASRVNSEMRAVLLKAVDHFKEITGSATKIKIPGSEYSYRLWRFWMTQEDFDFNSSITNGKVQIFMKLTKIFFAYTRLYMPISRITEIARLFRCHTQSLTLSSLNFHFYFQNILENNGILFYPSSPFPAGYHYTAYLRPFNFGYWCLFNVLKFPVCQVPLGLDKNGLPIGIQVVAGHYNDHLCVAVARELEKAFGGWVPPS